MVLVESEIKFLTATNNVFASGDKTVHYVTVFMVARAEYGADPQVRVLILMASTLLLLGVGFCFVQEIGEKRYSLMLSVAVIGARKVRGVGLGELGRGKRTGGAE